MQLSPGAVVGRYLVERKIGSGAMGEVWAGEHIGVGYRVAIKTMLAHGEGDPEIVKRFEREALLLGRIRSDYVARILDFSQDKEYGLVLILDLIEGEVFSATIRRTKLSVEEAIDFGIDVVNGLVDLHSESIVHRDLKPSNVILQPRRDGKKRAIIVDFGVSRLMKREGDMEELASLTRAGMALGTLEYMAPEQMLDSREATGIADLYAVGAMLFRAVSGSHAFGNVNEIELTRSKLMKETPPLVTGRSDPIAKEFEAIVGRSLKRKAVDRYRRAEDMLTDLERLRERLKREADDSEEIELAIESEPAKPAEKEVAKAPAAALSVSAAAHSGPALMQGLAQAQAPPARSQEIDVAPMNASYAHESMDLMRPGVSRPVLVVSVLGALLVGLVLGGLLLGGGQEAGAGADSSAMDAGAQAQVPPPVVTQPPAAPIPSNVPDASAPSRDAGKKRAVGGGLPGKPAKP